MLIARTRFYWCNHAAFSKGATPGARVTLERKRALGQE